MATRHEVEDLDAIRRPSEPAPTSRPRAGRPCARCGLPVAADGRCPSGHENGRQRGAERPPEGKN